MTDLKAVARRGRDLSLMASNRVGALVAPRIDLMHWRDKDGTENFGDEIGPAICEALVVRTGRSLAKPATRRRLWSVGSVMHRTRADDVVWGSGVNGNALGHRLAPGVDVRAVRGPRTAQWLREQGRRVPDAFGDPALLLPSLFPELAAPAGQRGRGPIVVVPHLYDVDKLGAFSADVDVVDPRGAWRDVVARIAGARLVVGSSLHALIVAEAFGVPARMLRLSEHEALFKYQDYFESTGRVALAFATDVDMAVAMGGEAPAVIDLAPLEAAFPVDLWRSS